MALGTGGHFAIVTDADAGLLAPDIEPPRALARGLEDGALFGQGLLLSRMRGLAQLAVDFVLIGVGHKLVEELVGAGQFDDAFGGQQRDQAFLPVVVAPFDLAFGLGRGGVEEFDAIEVESLAQLGEGVGVVGVKEGVVVHVEGQGQAVGLKDAGKEVEVGQQGFSRVEARAGVQARGVVENIQQDLFVGAIRQPVVWCGVVLPERAVIADLPAFDRFAGRFVAGVRGQVILDGPAPDAGAVGPELEATVQFAGDGTVGARRLGGEEFGDQGADICGPVWVVISAGDSRRPSVGLAVRTGLEVSGVKFVEAGVAETQFVGGGAGADLASGETVEQVTDERGGQTFDQLWFFIGAKITEGRWIYRFFAAPAEGGRKKEAGQSVETTRPFCRLQPSGGAQVASPQSPILR